MIINLCLLKRRLTVHSEGGAGGDGADAVLGFADVSALVSRHDSLDPQTLVVQYVSTSDRHLAVVSTPEYLWRRVATHAARELCGLVH